MAQELNLDQLSDAMRKQKDGNTTGKKIVIQAQSERYEQLAYFKALLKSSGVLDPSSVVSSEATKEENVVKITIEGNLPIGGDE